MKKNLLLLLAFVFTLSIFSSCGDSGEKYTPAIAGTWNTSPVVLDGENLVSSPVGMVWDAPEGTKLGFLPIKDVKLIAEGIGGQVLAQVLKDVTFHADGKISATYSDAGISIDSSNPVVPVWKKSGTGFATYKEVAGTNSILVFLDVKKIANGDPMADAILKQFPVLNDFITNGVPVRYEMSVDNKLLAVYIDREVVDKLLPLIEQILPMISDESLDGMGAIVKMMLEALPGAMEVTTKFELGLNLEK